MNISDLPIDAITPYSRNNRTHPEAQINRIAESIKTFGWTQPLLLDSKNTIVIGHGRFFAAQKLGLKKVPCAKLNGNLTPSQIKALRILDNKLQNDSEWDAVNVASEIEELLKDDFDIAKWGLDELKDMFPPEQPEVSDDDFDAPPLDEIKTTIKRGDIIEMGPHRVMCGDSTESESWTSGDVVFTSPPYNRGDTVELANKSVGKSSYIGMDDDLDECSYKAFLDKILNVSLAHSHVTLINLQLLAGNKRAIIRWLADNVTHFSDHLVWVKQQAAPAAAKNVVNTAHELLFIFKPTNEANRAIDTANFHGQYSSIIQSPPQHSNKSSNIHAATFPIEFAAKCLNIISQTGQTIIDPFLGSGTTLIAADQLNRICYGIEIEPKYCQVIVDRYRKYCADKNKSCEVKINGT